MVILTAVISLSIIAYCSASYSCSEEWHTRLHNSCYKIIGGNLTWSQASLRCREVGGHLAIITSDEENKYLKDYTWRHHALYPLWRYWLNGKDMESENHWYWDWTGQQIKYTHWRKEEPSNSGNNEDCLGMYGNGYWNDFNCESKCHAICEKEDVDVN